MQSQRGFTLIELIVTVAILSILITSGMIAISKSIATNNLNSANLILASQIRTMQQSSFGKQSTDTINITFRGNSYQVINSVTGNLPVVTLPNNITVSVSNSANNNQLSFDPTFSTNTKAMVTLTSSTLTQNNTQTIVLSSTTGRIRITSSNAPAYYTEEN